MYSGLAQHAELLTQGVLPVPELYKFQFCAHEAYTLEAQQHPEERHEETLHIMQVANVTFLGFLTPPKSPRVPLLYFDLPVNQQLDGVASNG